MIDVFKRLLAIGIMGSLTMISPGGGFYEAWAGTVANARESKTGVLPIQAQFKFSGPLQASVGYGSGEILPLGSLAGLNFSRPDALATIPPLNFPSTLNSGVSLQVGATLFPSGGAPIEYKPARIPSPKGPGDLRPAHPSARSAVGTEKVPAQSSSAGGVLSHLIEHASLPLWMFDSGQRSAGGNLNLSPGDQAVITTFSLSTGRQLSIDRHGLVISSRQTPSFILQHAVGRDQSGNPDTGVNGSQGISLPADLLEEFRQETIGGGSSASSGPPSSLETAPARDLSIWFYVSGLVLMMFGEQAIDPSMQTFLAKSSGNSAMLSVMTVSLIGRFLGNLFTAIFVKPHLMKKFLLTSMTVRIGAIGGLLIWFLGPEYMGPLRDSLAPLHDSPDYFSYVVMALMGIYSFMRGIHSNAGALEGPIVKLLVGNNKLKLEQVGSIKEWVNQIASIAGPLIGVHLAFAITNVGTIGLMPLALLIAVLMFAFGVHLPKARANGAGTPESSEDSVESPTTDKMVGWLLSLASAHLPALLHSVSVRALLVLSSSASRVEAGLRKIKGFVGLFIDNPMLRLASLGFMLFILPNYFIFQGLASAYGSFAGAGLLGTNMITAKLFSLVSVGLLGGGLVHWREGRLLTHLRDSASNGAPAQNQSGARSALSIWSRRILLPFVHLLDRFVMSLYLRRILDKVKNIGAEEAEEAVLNASLLFFMRCSAVLLPVAFYAMTFSNPMGAFIALPLFFFFDVAAYTKLRALYTLEAEGNATTIYPMVNAVLVATAALSVFSIGQVFSFFPKGSPHPFEIFSVATDFLALTCVIVIHKFIKRLRL